ncbi:hypothetical protein [Mycobacterium sp.]|uniref:hypothetical protein n=1 Tax=Mycobacterium sp. TaxID=1785 RepID=UPI002B632381|nr:hypothetical protein [Mycobacterium sp.]HTY30333.1 hypothetical protein [Mycobacterium sp.]
MPRLPNSTAKILIGVTIAVGAGVVGSATAAADPGAFSTLSCSCQQAAPAGSPARKDAIARGIRQGLSDWPVVTG